MANLSKFIRRDNECFNKKIKWYELWDRDKEGLLSNRWKGDALNGNVLY